MSVCGNTSVLYGLTHALCLFQVYELRKGATQAVADFRLDHRKNLALRLELLVEFALSSE